MLHSKRSDVLPDRVGHAASGVGAIRAATAKMIVDGYNVANIYWGPTDSLLTQIRRKGDSITIDYVRI